jgi:pimeloyl-ACP methyl ester carboxylesterase
LFSQAAPHGFRITVQTNLTLYVRQSTAGGGVTALLIHGTADSGVVWHDLANTLSDYCQVLTIDLRGHGASDHDILGQYTVDAHVKDILKVIGELPETELILIGHSLGGSVAAKIAPDLGQRLRALVLVDAGPDMNRETAEFLQNDLRLAHRPYESIAEYCRWLQDRRVLTSTAICERLATESLTLGLDGRYRLRYDISVLAMLTAEEDQTWWMPKLRRTLAPVLFVRGMASAALSKQTAERMCAVAANGRLVTVPAAGHAVMSDNPDGFIQAVMPFVASALLSQRT